MHISAACVLLAALASLSLAQSTDSDCGCPSDYNYLEISNTCWCCPGTINAYNGNSANLSIFGNQDPSTIDGYCCVHSADFSDTEKRDSARQGGLEGDILKRQATTIDGQACSTTIPLTASDYSSLALAASTLTGAVATSITASSNEASATSHVSDGPSSSAANSDTQSTASATGNLGVSQTVVPALIFGGLGLAALL